MERARGANYHPSDTRFDIAGTRAFTENPVMMAVRAFNARGYFITQTLSREERFDLLSGRKNDIAKLSTKCSNTASLFDYVRKTPEMIALVAAVHGATPPDFPDPPTHLGYARWDEATLNKVKALYYTNSAGRYEKIARHPYADADVRESSLQKAVIAREMAARLTPDGEEVMSTQDVRLLVTEIVNDELGNFETRVQRLNDFGDFDTITPQR